MDGYTEIGFLGSWTAIVRLIFRSFRPLHFNWPHRVIFHILSIASFLRIFQFNYRNLCWLQNFDWRLFTLTRVCLKSCAFIYSNWPVFMFINRERNRKESHLEMWTDQKRGRREQARGSLLFLLAMAGLARGDFHVLLSFSRKQKRKNMKHHAQRIFFSILYWSCMWIWVPELLSIGTGHVTWKQRLWRSHALLPLQQRKKMHTHTPLCVFLFVFKDNIRIILAEILIRFLFVCVTNRPKCVALQAVRSTLTRWPNLNQSDFSSIMTLIVNE